MVDVVKVLRYVSFLVHTVIIKLRSAQMSWWVVTSLNAATATFVFETNRFFLQDPTRTRILLSISIMPRFIGSLSFFIVSHRHHTYTLWNVVQLKCWMSSCALFSFYIILTCTHTLTTHQRNITTNFTYICYINCKIETKFKCLCRNGQMRYNQAAGVL